MFSPVAPATPVLPANVMARVVHEQSHECCATEQRGMTDSLRLICMAERSRQMREEIERVVRVWPAEPRESANRLIDYYGQPQEFSASQLIWYATKDGWK